MAETSTSTAPDILPARRRRVKWVKCWPCAGPTATKLPPRPDPDIEDNKTDDETSSK